MAIRFDNGYKEFYLPEETGDILKGYAKGESIVIRAVPIREYTYKNDSGYGSYLCEEVLESNEKMPGTFLISGTFVEPIDIGQTYEIDGTISQYKGQNQVKVKEIRKVLPTSKRGIISFIKSLNGVGIYPELIYDRFGDESLSILRDNPEKILDEFPTLWEEKVLDWQKQLNEIKDDHYIMARLMGYGLKPTQIKALFDKFGGAILTKIQDNPYFLSSEVRNYSFKKCDEIAQNMGLSPSNQDRINEGVYYCVNMAQYEGHTYLPYDKLIESAKDTLALKIGIQAARRLKKSMGTADRALYQYGNMTFQVSKAELEKSIEKYKEAKTKLEKEEMKICVFEPTMNQLNSALEFLNMSNRIYIDGDKIFEFYSYRQEQKISYNLKRLLSGFKKVNSNLEAYLDLYCEKKGINLEQRQKEAILGICSGKGGVFILNGSAGCGKTFCLGIAIEMLKKIYQKTGGFLDSAIVAPTGKAAQVASSATGMDASTVHRFLKYSPDSGYQYNSTNKLYFDLLVIDESSMLDVDLTAALLEALDTDTKVVFVGDTKQLPSVGAGNVLKDMIKSEKIPVVTLNVVKRQGKDSGIIKNANKIIAGDIPKTEMESGDAYVYNTDSSYDCVEKVLKVVHKSIESGLSINDIQVLSPQKRGLTGTNYMNYLLQSELNPDEEGLMFYNKSISVPEIGNIDVFFKKGDKVIHTKNNYNAQWYAISNKKLIKLNEVGVANGECGVIIKLSEREDEYKNKIKTIYVKYDNKIIKYDDDFSELDLAYALTIHKSQGSQWNTAIIPIMSSNYMMLDREILYTGYTRAQKMNFMIAEANAIRTALARVKSEERYTGLSEMLKNI